MGFCGWPWAERQGRALAQPQNAIMYLVNTNVVDTSEQFGSVFYLEDETGRIKVDPRGARIRSSWAPNLDGRVREMVLTRRVRPRAAGMPEIRMLLDGDPVYLIGNVETDRDRPVGKDGLPNLVVKIRDRNQSALSGKNQDRFDVHDVFFLSDTLEEDAARHIRSGLWKAWLTGAVWILASAWLALFAA